MASTHRFGKVHHQIHLVLIVIVAATMLAGCPAYYELLLAVTGAAGVSIRMGDTVLAVTLRDAVTPITYNQEHMEAAEPGAPEYEWGVLMDVDDDPLTGDADGFEVHIQAQLLNGSDDTLENNLSAPMADLIALLDVEPFLESDGVHEERPIGMIDNTLYFGCKAEDIDAQWYAATGTRDDISPTVRLRFYARWTNPPDPGTTIVDTVELIGEGTADDPAEDVSLGCIDIIQVTFDHPQLETP